MNPYLVFGLGAVAGIGLRSYGRPLLVRLVRAGMTATGYAMAAGSSAAEKTGDVAAKPPARSRTAKKKTALPTPEATP